MNIQTAYEIASRPVMTVMASPVPKGMDRYRLSPYEMHALATRLVEQCESRLTATELAFARYRYGKDKAALHALTDHIERLLATDVSRRKGVERILWAYFGGAVGVHRLRAALHCSMTRAVNYQAHAFAELDALKWRVKEAFIERELRSKPPQASVVPQAGIDPQTVSPEGRSRHLR